MGFGQIVDDFLRCFRTYFCRSLHGEQPQQTIKNCQKPSEISITKLHSTHLPFCKTPATATNARTKAPIYKVRGRRCSRRMAHSDPPPPASGQAGNGVLGPLRVFLQISEIFRLQSLTGPTLRRRPLPQKSCKGPLDRLRPPFS